MNAPEMPINPNIHQAIVAPTAIRLDNAAGTNLAPNNGLQGCSECIRDGLGVDAVTALEQTKGDSFTTRSPSAHAANTFGPKVGLIGFQLAFKLRLSCTAWAIRTPSRW